MVAKKDASKTLAKPSLLELTEAEWAIMKVVWKKQPCAAGEVQEHLQDTRDWAYSTVKTTMDRMAKKGLLQIESIRNLQLFRANLTEKQAKRNEILKTLKRAFDGAMSPMMQFLVEQEEFSSDELRQLRTMIQKTEKRK